MVESRWFPCILTVAVSALSWETSCLMVWIGGIIILIDVAPGAGIGGVGVIAVVAHRTIVGDGGMGSLDDIIIIVYIKGSG